MSFLSDCNDIANQIRGKKSDGRNQRRADPESPFMRLTDVLAYTGLSRTALYTLMAEGKFPRPRHPTTRAAFWVKAEVEAWVKQVVEGQQ